MSVCQKGVGALAVAVALVSAGCGFGLSGPDPQRPRNEMPKCDTGKGAVVIDGLMATAAGIVALSLLANDLPAPALIPAGIGALYIGGAVHGSRAVDECRAAMDEFSQGVAARDTLDRTPPPRSLDDEMGEQAPPIPKKQRPAPPPVAVQPPPPTPVVEAPSSDAEQEPAEQPPAPAKQPPPKKKMPPSRPAPSDDEWSEFWREVQ